MEYRDYYKVLGVARDASQDDIKRSYRKLARKYHPDVSKEANADERFKELGEAYEVLRDPEKRSAYDQLGANWQSGQDFRPPPDWAEGFEFRGGGFTDAGSGGFSDFFESLFGAGFGAARQSRGGQFDLRGEDSRSRVLIDIEDAYRGGSRLITLRHSELGAGGRPQVRDRSLNVTIPKGIRQGQQIRLAGQGSPGVGQGAAGDLYLDIQFRPHSFYRVEGADVYLDLPVAPWEAALGASIQAPTPDGRVDLKIPAGSRSGGELRLKGRGIPGSPPGDLYAVLQVQVPPADSEVARQLYREMQQKLNYNPRARLGV